MSRPIVVGPEHTAARVALWRALHVEVDPPPHVLEDEVGLRLVAPEPGWQQRPDMSPFTRPFRASIVARARFIEDLVEAQAVRGVEQYVILGAGLDTFAQRRPELAARLHVFEIDQPGPQAWKRQRLDALGYGVPSYLHLVPVDFEAGDACLPRTTCSRSRVAPGSATSRTCRRPRSPSATSLAAATACGRRTTRRSWSSRRPDRGA